MNTHPHLRAYLAGVALPTFGLPFMLFAYAIGRYALQVPVPIERLIVFPLALVPFLWGAWNVLYFVWGARLPLGIHGAILFLVLGPVAYVASRLVLGLTIPLALFLGGVYPAFAIIYYFFWKYVVAFFNRLLGLA